MFVHSSSRFQKLSSREIDNLTYKEARQIANYARTLINKRIDYLRSRGLGDASEDLFKAEYDWKYKNYRIPTIPQNEDISFYKRFIKEMKINYEDTSVKKAVEKIGTTPEISVKITLKKLKYLYIKNGGNIGSDSEIQNFVDEEFGGDWDIYWNSFIPEENIDNLLSNDDKYKTLLESLRDLYRGI